MTAKVKKLLKQLHDNKDWDGALENELASTVRSVLNEQILVERDILAFDIF